MTMDLKCSDCEEKLSDYIERALGEVEQSIVDRHLHACQACSELLAGMMMTIEAARNCPVYAPPAWLATRIIANTTQTPRPSPRSLPALLAAVWRSLGEPRTALAIFTATVVIGWAGSLTAREAIFNRAESVVSCVYDRAIRSYYRSPMVIELHSRLGQLMENS
jgi:hypothetical protein